MLQFIRSKASSWVIKILFFCLIIAFGVWGIGDVLHQAPPIPTVAAVGGTTITLTDYQREYEQKRASLSRLLGAQFTDELAKQMRVPQQVLDTMVSRALYVEMATSMGMRVSPDLQRHLLETTPAFQDQTGHFNITAFET